MKKVLIIVFAVALCQANLFAQTPNAKKLIAQINQKFAAVKDYTADVEVQFAIPSVKMSNIKAKVFYKKPNKFRMRAKGVLFLPKQNPMQQIQGFLSDTASFSALISGQEKVNGINCYIVNIIPTKQTTELILGKFWIDPSKNLILKSDITTKNGGTITSLNTYGTQSGVGLPDKMEIIMDVNKFKIPKIMAMDINKKKSKDADKVNQREEAKIFLSFQNFKINTAFDDKVFAETN